jgi:hypothetical protein
VIYGVSANRYVRHLMRCARLRSWRETSPTTREASTTPIASTSALTMVPTRMDTTITRDGTDGTGRRQIVIISRRRKRRLNRRIRPSRHIPRFRPSRRIRPT